MPASCLRTLSKVAFFLGSPFVSSNVSIASSSAPHCSSTSLDVWRVESASRQGWRMRDTGEVLPPGAANPLPVRHRGGAGGYPALCLCDVDTVSLVILLHRLQVLSGLLEVPFGLAQTTEDAKRIPLGQVMAQVKQIRDARAPQPRVGQLDQRLGAVTHPRYNT